MTAFRTTPFDRFWVVRLALGGVGSPRELFMPSTAAFLLASQMLIHSSRVTPDDRRRGRLAPASLSIVAAQQVQAVPQRQSAVGQAFDQQPTASARFLKQIS
jgi:hypothetical protein